MSGGQISSIHLAASSRPLTPKGAADFLELDDKTITRWARKGYIPGHPMGEGKRKYWRIYESELREWLATKASDRMAASAQDF
jgi:excisionase family DNA binding protein